MDPRLRLHNSVLGLAHRSPPWPAPLVEAGYEVVRIEQPVSLQYGGKVVVDLMFVARERNALLVVECKEGTVQENQARGYQAMQPLDVVRTASITLADPTAATLDVAYAVPGDWADNTVAELSRLAPRAGVLVVDTQIEWLGSSATDSRLHGVFAGPWVADLRAVPRLMIADEHSPAAAVAPGIANEIHAAIESGLESITVAGLIERACWGWPRYGRAFQGQLVRKVDEMLRDAQGKELKDLIVLERPTGQSSATVRLRSRPGDPATQAGELRGARAVRNRLDSFRARVTGRPVPTIPGQLELLSGWEDDDEEDDDHA